MDKPPVDSFNQLKQDSIARLVEFVSDTFMNGVKFTADDIRLIPPSEGKGIIIEITDPERLAELAEAGQPFTLLGRPQASYEVKFNLDASGSFWANYEGTFLDTSSGSGATLLDNPWFKGVLIMATEQLTENVQSNIPTEA